MATERELLFSLGPKDFEVETFRCGGKGGQNVNKVETGVRIRHPASGAVCEGREHRNQLKNKKAAFERLVTSETFKRWHQLECARHLGILARVENEVETAMHPENLRIEVQHHGRWTAETGTFTCIMCEQQLESSQAATTINTVTRRGICTACYAGDDDD